MKKRKFYNYLAKKYNLPYEYIKYKVNPIYIYKANVELSENQCREIENSIYWDYVREDFEKDRQTESSIFFGM